MPDDDPAARITPFHEFIEGLESGKVSRELTSALAVLVEDVNRLGKKGSVVLKLEVKPAGQPGQQVYVSPHIILNAPDPDPFPSVFYVGNSGTIHRNDPFAGQLFEEKTGAPPVAVDTEGGAPRAVGPGADGDDS